MCVLFVNFGDCLLFVFFFADRSFHSFFSSFFFLSVKSGEREI